MNPVLKGLFADPDIIKVDDTYYLYPTTDGFDGWGGYQFYVFSSSDKVNWKNEGKIIDFKEGNVKWAVACAWAPCTLAFNEKFYFYFCGKRPDGVSCIGVAVSDDPQGPYEAMDEPLITPELVRGLGLEIGQAIDPSVYVENGKAYLLFGNGNPIIVELDSTCLGIKCETMKPIEGAYEFREAIEVFKKDGKYHFTWSCDDTGSENYHVNYGISDSLYGKIDYKYPILCKKPEDNILGTGHHSILANADEYLIAYHRFGTPLDKYPEGKGFHREICIDKIDFGKDGLISKIIPTR